MDSKTLNKYSIINSQSIVKQDRKDLLENGN